MWSRRTLVGRGGTLFVLRQWRSAGTRGRPPAVLCASVSQFLRTVVSVSGKGGVQAIRTVQIVQYRSRYESRLLDLERIHRDSADAARHAEALGLYGTWTPMSRRQKPDIDGLTVLRVPPHHVEQGRSVQKALQGRVKKTGIPRVVQPDADLEPPGPRCRYPVQCRVCRPRRGGFGRRRCGPGCGRVVLGWLDLELDGESGSRGRRVGGHAYL